MLADSIINLGWLMIKPFVKYGPDILSKLHCSLSKRNRPWRQASGAISNSNRGYDVVHGGAGASSAHAKSPDGHDDDAPPSDLISVRTVLALLPLTLILNVICMHIAFGSLISPLLATLATLLALVLSIMGVRALGETDLNPVSGISKLTQLVFAIATPASSHTRRTAIVTNLLAGAVSESGALQAGDMMQDLKTGHLVGASPKAQFYGQLIGSLVGSVISAAVYKLYVNVYEVPGPIFQVPTAQVWIFTARLVTGQGLPVMAWQVAGIAGIIFAIGTIFRIAGASFGGGSKSHCSACWRAWIPGGVAVAVGMYNVPSFTLARATGGVIAWWWGWGRGERGWNANMIDPSGSQHPVDHQPAETNERAGSPARSSEEGRGREEGWSSAVVILASGLILGEGVVSILNLILATAGVPHL